MAEGAKQATRAVPGAAARARAAGQATEPARAPQRMFSEPGKAAERNAESRAARALSGSSMAQSRSPRQQNTQAQRAPDFAPSGVQDGIERARGGGNALGADLREQLQPRFHHELGDVRLHTDSRADALSQALDARAFTVGSDIFFRAGAYAPDTAEGWALLGHELTHVDQQGGASIGRLLEIGPADDTFERAADAGAGDRVRREKQVTVRCQRDKPEVVEFPPELVLSLPPGESPADFILHQVGLMKDSSVDYFNNYRDGLSLFEKSMIFSSEQEAESHYLKSILTAAVKVDIDILLEHVIEECPGLGPTIKQAKELITAVIEEHERIETAEGEVKIVEFIDDRLTEVGKIQPEVRAEFDKQTRPMLVAYAQAVRGTGEEPRPDSSTVSGPGAKILDDLERAQKRLREQVSKKSTAVFQQQFTESFATLGSSRVGPITAGNFHNATMYLNCSVYRSESGVYSLQSIDESWELKTNAPRPERVASSLDLALRAQRKEPVDSDLEKIVRATIERESGHFYTINDRDDTSYSFTDIEHVYYDTVQAIVHGHNPAEFGEAWDAVLKEKVKGIKKLRGSGA
jgi:hypothetical protein